MSQRVPIRRVHSDQVPTRTLVREVESFGFSVVNDVLDSAKCRELTRYIEGEIAKGPEERPLGSIVEKANRYDTPFLADGLPGEMLAEVCRHRVLGQLLGALVGSEGTLKELSALTSYPGAAAQRLHTDTSWAPGDALLACVFVALDDIDEAMGPLEIVWKSSRGRPAEAGATVQRMTVDRGDAVVMDSTAAHRGGANRSQDKMRPVFYFSLLSPKGSQPSRDTFSIMENEGERVTLGQILRG